MEEQMIKIDVEKIMEEIRADIKAKGYTNDLLSFQDVAMDNTTEDTKFNMDEMNHCTHAANVNARVEYYHQIIPHHGLKNLIKIFIRKFLRFLLQPLVEEQNRYNADAVQTINQLTRFVQEQTGKNEELEEIIQQMQKRIVELEAKE